MVCFDWSNDACRSKFTRDLTASRIDCWATVYPCHQNVHMLSQLHRGSSNRQIQVTRIEIDQDETLNRLGGKKVHVNTTRRPDNIIFV